MKFRSTAAQRRLKERPLKKRLSEPVAARPVVGILPTPYYSQDGITIYHGDCRDILPHLDVFDHVITDAPYDEKTHKGARYGFRETSSAISFAPLDLVEAVPLMLSAARRWVITFCALEMFGAYRDLAGDSWVRAGFWRRTNGVPQFTGDRPGQPGEGLAIMHAPGTKMRWHGHGSHAFWEYPIVSGGPHPTTKPEPLMMDIINDFTDRTDIVVDPYMGSGTTLVAAKRLGRRAVGIELTEKYCEAAVKRLRQNYFVFEEPDPGPVVTPSLPGMDE